MKEQQRVKVYVRINVAFDPDGRMRPVSIFWEDGQKYIIDRVTDVRQAASMRCGGQGDRYTIWVNNQQTYLFFERNASLTGNNIGRWFVEKVVA